MTTRPSKLKAPALSDYPFISLVFAERAGGFENSEGKVVIPEMGLHTKIGEKLFDWPSAITVQTLAPIEAMTDATFSALCSILRPKHGETQIDSKLSLALLSEKRRQYVKPDEENGLADFSFDQLQAFTFFEAELSQNIHWGNLVQLYNESDRGQQEAIYQYFSIWRGMELETLLAHKAHEIAVPSAVQESFETRHHAGNDFIFCNERQKWLRDDRFYQQYRLDVSIDGSSASFLLSSAPTLKQAVAKATAYVLSGMAGHVGRIEIYKSGAPVGHAAVRHTAVPAKDGQPATKKSKLKWSFDDVGVDIAHIDALKRYWKLAKGDYQHPAEVAAMEADIERMEALKAGTPPISSEQLASTVQEVEKAMGLQWSKVHRLEEDLGI